MRVSLFVPCLVDRFLPQVGVATVRLLESVGVRIDVDSRQTCCGQPPFNAGHWGMTLPLARRFLRLFAHASAVVVPSGSCAAMVRDSYGMLDLSEEDFQRWNRLRTRVFELAEFLAEHDLVERVQGRLEARVAVHRSCHHLRHTRGARVLDALLQRVEGLELVEAMGVEQCCGFGGVFSAKLPELSVSMGKDLLVALAGSRPDYVALPDAGCMLHLRGIQTAPGGTETGGKEREEALVLPFRVVHYAQLITGDGLDEREGGP